MRVDHEIRWRDHQSPVFFDEQTHEVVMLDQRLLPLEQTWLRYQSHDEVAQAITEMVVRGAPAIGCAAAFGLAAAAMRYPDEPTAFAKAFASGVETLAASRPTAVNLFWALERSKAAFGRSFHGTEGANGRGQGQGQGNVGHARRVLIEVALDIWRDDLKACRTMGALGAELIGPNARILTHCNAGALATAGYGTALGVIRSVASRNDGLQVYADETRPFLQGARLTAWELKESGIDVTVICDNMAGSLMQSGAITHCVVGSDRIAHNGDVANKIGTYMVAVLAKRHNIPFYVAAPLSTIDLNTQSGKEIPIEERPALEVTHVGPTQIVPKGVPVRNIAFDTTPAELVTGIITEAGVARVPYERSLRGLFG